MPFADFAAKRLMKGITPEGAVARGATAAAKTNVKTNAKAGRKLAQTPPAAWDWRALGKVPPARNQGGCGSCWAFAGELGWCARAMVTTCHKHHRCLGKGCFRAHG